MEESKARAMLVKMLFDTNSKAHKLSWQELHASHEWFREYEPKKFILFSLFPWFSRCCHHYMLDKAETDEFV